MPCIYSAWGINEPLSTGGRGAVERRLCDWGREFKILSKVPWIHFKPPCGGWGTRDEIGVRREFWSLRVQTLGQPPGPPAAGVFPSEVRCTVQIYAFSFRMGHNSPGNSPGADSCQLPCPLEWLLMPCGTVSFVFSMLCSSLKMDWWKMRRSDGSAWK